MNLKEQAESLGIKVDGRWSDERIQKEIDDHRIKLSDDFKEPEKPEPSKVTANKAKARNETDNKGDDDAVPQAKEEAPEKMNVLAQRIWGGQSVTLPKTIRMQRIVSRLKDKGYTDKDLESLNIG